MNNIDKWYKDNQFTHSFLVFSSNASISWFNPNQDVAQGHAKGSSAKASGRLQQAAATGLSGKGKTKGAGK